MTEQILYLEELLPKERYMGKSSEVLVNFFCSVNAPESSFLSEKRSYKSSVSKKEGFSFFVTPKYDSAFSDCAKLTLPSASVLVSVPWAIFNRQGYTVFSNVGLLVNQFCHNSI